MSQTETKTEDMRIEMIEKLSKLPNITNRIEALRASDKFSDIGEVLSPVSIATMKITEEKPISKQVEPIAKEERKQLRERLHDSGVEVLAFLGGNGNANDPEPAPAPVIDPLVCTHCGAKLKPSMVKCPNCGAPVMPQQKQPIIPAWIKPHTMKFLDFFAGAVVFVMWIAATLLIINSFGLGPWTIIGLGIFWIVFVVVYRVVAGGILD